MSIKLQQHIPYRRSTEGVAREHSEAVQLGASFGDYLLTRSVTTRDEIIASTNWIARRSARHFAHRGEPLDDLEQVAAIGLLKAIERFDPSRGIAFGAFATPTIMGELRRHFRDRTWTVYVPRRAKDQRGIVRNATETLGTRLHRPPSAAEIADHLAISSELVTDVQRADAARRTTSLATDGSWVAGHVVGERGAADAAYDAVLDRATLSTLFVGLTPRSRLVLELRYFDQLTQLQIAGRIGTSQAHVGRLITAALSTMRSTAAIHDAA